MSYWISQSPEGRPLPKVSHAEGVYVYGADGKRYVDGSGGPGLFSLGHRHPEVIDAIKRQLDDLPYGFSMSFTTDVAETLSERIVQVLGAHFGGVFFVSSGSEATEHAMQAAIQYHHAKGEPDRVHFIGRRLSWHGQTFGAFSVGHNMARRRIYESVLDMATHVSTPNTYRPPAGITPEAMPAYFADELEQEIQRAGADRVAAFVFEPVGGGACGVLPPPPGYVQAMRDVCDRHGVLMIADEVLCGVGRCGTWRAAEPEGVWPDMMTIAKGLSGGHMPLGACVMSRTVRQAIEEAYGNFDAARTYSGHTASCAAALAVLTIMERDNLVAKVAEDGVYLKANLDQTLGQVDIVGDIRGRGFLWGIELVEDRETKEPFDPALKLFMRVRDKAMENGLLIYPGGGVVDGVKGDYVLVSPPYNATRTELDEIVDKLALSIASVTGELRTTD